MWFCRFLLSCFFIVAAFTAGHCTTVYTDAVGRSIVLAAPPQRIVSLVPSVTEILYAIHAQQQLVGVTDFCTYPRAASAKASVGAYASPSLEAVANLTPDLIIMGMSSSSPVLLQQFEQLGVPVYIVAPRSTASTLDTISSLGQLTGHEDVAQPLVAQLREQMALIRSQRGEHQVRTLVCVMIEPLIVAGGGTLADDLITVAGGVNVAAQQERYPTWGMEAVLAYDPELIVVSVHPGTPMLKDYFLQWPQLQAVRKQQVVTINADWLQRPGPRLFNGLRELARYFSSVNKVTVRKVADVRN
ncbi:MAG: cobalamin-binding protein [Thermodesulfobacteriota bacterium]|nr:cobalamin-binding protein [Thermodesulfobacteriota bacterium]